MPFVFSLAAVELFNAEMRLGGAGLQPWGAASLRLMMIVLMDVGRSLLLPLLPLPGFESPSFFNNIFVWTRGVRRSSRRAIVTGVDVEGP